MNVRIIILLSAIILLGCKHNYKKRDLLGTWDVVSSIDIESGEITFLEEDDDGFVNIGKDKWYEGDMKIFDTLFTDTMGLDKSKSRDENAVFTPSDTTKANMKEMYLVNQDYLQKKYGNTMTLYRGVNGNTYDEFKNLKEGEKASVDTYNISSWSSDPDIAERFAKGSKKGVVIKVEVPTKYVLIHYDTFDVSEDYKDEKEVVLGGNQFTGEIMSFHERGGPK